ncbi:hypothetical protein EPH_0000520 [Eimeria praecox]|uniref:Atg6 BARA domain-containing protein n=1 Tax=Eimeria praecox TaxID=51316 RepID=U6G0Y4_9EIME|nr:hypothetical protein EPH_0000520 [Eimeria praecox]
MESMSSQVQPLPTASFVCESCSRHVVVVLDSSTHLLSTPLQTGRQLKREVSSPAGAEHPLRVQRCSIPEGQLYQNEAAATLQPKDDAEASAPLQRPLQQELHQLLQPPPSSTNESGTLLAGSSAPSPFADPADSSGPPVPEDCAAVDSEMMYPLCVACLDASIAEVEPSTAHEKRLVRKYEKALRRLQRRSLARASPTQEQTAAEGAAGGAVSTLAEMRQLEEEERKLEAEISSIEASMAQKEAQKRSIVAELAELHMWHVEFWLLYTHNWLRMTRHAEVNR